MGGPGSGNKGGVSRGGSRDESRSGSQIRRRGHATAPTIRKKILHEEDEQNKIMESHQEERANDPDENEISSDEEDVVPNEEVRSIEVKLPKDAVKIPASKKKKWPSWRIQFWKNWHIVYSNRKVSAQCKHCNDGKYHHGLSDSFSNFLRHSRRCHEEEYNKVTRGEEQIPSNQSYMKNSLDTKIPKDTQKKIDILLAEMVVLDNLPLTVLQREGFRRLISFIAPTYNLPSYEKMRDTIIPSIYTRTVEVVKTVLKSCDVVNITLGLCSSNSMDGFMGVSCSSVTADFAPFTCFLNMKEMPPNHTAEVMQSVYDFVVSDWELNGKVTRTVTDKASNMTKAFQLQSSNFIKEDIEDEFIEMEIEAVMEVPNYVLIPENLEGTSSTGGSQNDELGIANGMSTLEIDLEGLIQEHCQKINETSSVRATLSHAECLHHQTQLVIKDGLKALEKLVSESLDLLCKIVSEVRRSVVDTKVLLDSVGFKIPMMNLTSWKSQFSCVKHFLNGIDIDSTLQSKLNACKAHGSLSSLQLKYLREFVTLLEPFKIAIDVFQKDTETVGLVIPLYLNLLNQCSLDPRVNQKAKFITSCKCMAEELSISLSERMGWVLKDPLFVLGSLLHPRIKGTWITEARKEEDVIATFKKLLRCLGEKVEGGCIEENSDSGGENERKRKANENSSATPVHKCSRQSPRPLHASVLVRSRTLSRGESKILDEFDNYFREPTVVNEKGQFDLHFSPCEYWKLNQHRFPALASFAKDIMGIPCSSAYIEHAFKTAGDILSAKRNKPNSKLFNMLLFIKLNAQLLGTVSDESSNKK